MEKWQEKHLKRLRMNREQIDNLHDVVFNKLVKIQCLTLDNKNFDEINNITFQIASEIREATKEKSNE